MVSRWDALTRYIEDGHIEIDNNAAERSLRGVAPGRKNYLFAGSEDRTPEDIVSPKQKRNAPEKFRRIPQQSQRSCLSVARRGFVGGNVLRGHVKGEHELVRTALNS
jgi:hypothetical protein